ncbi:uncharacterized protein NPIL_164491 [Nephila pilipes]|uniref:Uncharacterized protein n=1 Tax=Nephila pilipes TaxID=299642 RepID=A0A8X6Q4L6_NEPPI|nr:uncharacterized protein NPIL_164491 [Nephila pilipes]
MSRNVLEKIFLPILIIFHCIGVETLPCPKFYRKWKILTWVWNSPKYLSVFLVAFCLTFQIAWMFLISNTKRDVAVFAILILQISAHVTMYRSRRLVKTLPKTLSKLCKTWMPDILFRKWNALRILIVLYTLCTATLIPIFIVALLSSEIGAEGQEYIKNSLSISQEFKKPLSLIIDVRSVVNTAVKISIAFPFSGYYCFICICIKLVLRNFISTFKFSNGRINYQTVLETYDDISLIIILADDFLCYPALVNVLNGMAGLFWSGFTIAFILKKDYQSYVCLFGCMLFYSCLLLLVLLPASVANQAAEEAKDVIISLPGWFPQHYNELKIYVRKKFKQRKSKFTLWKIYKINKSLIISTLGTLLTYGFLIGTLGTVRNAKDDEM